MKGNFVISSICTVALGCMLIGCACNDRNSRKHIARGNSGVGQVDVGEIMASLNRYLSEKDKLIIEGYAMRHKLAVNLADGGFYYEIFDKGTGKQVKSGDRVELLGSVSLIDGTQCYSYSIDNPKIVVIEKSADITGLHVALPMLREGAKAIFIFPPNLAFGLLGDGDKIPSRSILVMNIEVLKVYE